MKVVAMEYTYWNGEDAARRALDRTTLNATDLLVQNRQAESRCRTAGDNARAEYHKGFADHVQEFLDDKGR